VYKLAFVFVSTLARGFDVPLFAHFSLVIFVRFLTVIHLVQAVSISTVVVEFTDACLHEVFAEFSLIIDSEVLNIFNHGLPGWKIHLLFRLLLDLTIEPHLRGHAVRTLPELHQRKTLNQLVLIFLHLKDLVANLNMRLLL
jgi:hypothetical protein